MSDLISRSALIEEMKKTEIEYENAMMCPSWWSAFNIIREQPTAYNIDKVIEEIKTLKEEALGEYNMGEYNLDNNIGNSISENYRKDMNEGKCFAYDDAIEIVKQGGDANGVCEWKKYPFNWFAGCDGRKVEYKQGDYCPRCGKKIKIKAVE